MLILLDCCAGAASATFPNGKSITETISASSWDAIAPDPGRYSFTNALIEVLGEWRFKTFSAAMLHAEVLARLKHPRPILINGKRFEARATPVHFMMTSDHRAPSIEMTRLLSSDRCPPSPPRDPSPFNEPVLGRGPSDGECFTEPNEDKPHVMISLALEDNQRLDLNAWEQWLASFPALAKYVKVQGVFKSHSTLLLLSMPVTLWDLLPDDQACSFVAFIRSNNLIRKPDHAEAPVQTQVEMVQSDGASIFSGTTFRDSILAPEFMGQQQSQASSQNTMAPWGVGATVSSGKERAQAPGLMHASSDTSQRPSLPSSRSVTSIRTVPLPLPLKGVAREEAIVRQPLINQSRNSKRTVFSDDLRVPEGPRLASHVVSRLETYFAADPNPSDGTTEYYASHLGIEATDVKVRTFTARNQRLSLTNIIQLWFYHRRLQQKITVNAESEKAREWSVEATTSLQALIAPLKQGKDIDDDSYFGDRKAHLVSSLATGLDKMREASGTGGSAPSRNSSPRPTVPDKLGEFPSVEYDEFDEVDPRETSQSPTSSGAGRSSVPNSSGTSHSARRVGHEDHSHIYEEGQGRHRTGLWRRLRSNSSK